MQKQKLATEYALLKGLKSKNYKQLKRLNELEIMKKQNKQEQWEIDFDKKFEYIEDGDYATSSAFITNDKNRPHYDLEDVKQFIQDLLSQSRQEVVEEIEKTLNGWFEENFHYPKVLSDDAYVTEKQLYDFIKSLSSKK